MLHPNIEEIRQLPGYQNMRGIICMNFLATDIYKSDKFLVEKYEECIGEQVRMPNLVAGFIRVGIVDHLFHL